MTQQEIGMFNKAVRGLFPDKGETPGVTDDQLKLIGERIKECHDKRALAVLKNHALSHVFLDIPNLLEGLRADIAKLNERKRDEQSKRVIDWIRSERGKSGDTSVYKMSNVDLINQYYDRCAEAVRGYEAPKFGIDFALRKIESDRPAALAELTAPRRERADEAIPVFH